MFVVSVILVSSGDSFVMSNNVWWGIATLPGVSMLAGRFTIMVISKSVVLSTVPVSCASKRTLFKIGRVDRVGVALESF